MTHTQPNPATRESTRAMARYEALDPIPTDPKRWFDHHYPDEARPVVVVAERGAELAIRAIHLNARPLTERQVLRFVEEHGGYPGWQFSDSSGIFFNPHQQQVWDIPGDEYHKRLVTPDQLVESTFLVEELGVFGTINDIRKAVHGLYQDRIHLLLESPFDFLREQVILALGGCRRPKGAGNLRTH